MANKVAPDDQVFVCGACGKMSKDRYGMQPISGGWDESCMLNSILCRKDKLVFNKSGTLVIKVEDDGIVEEEDEKQGLSGPQVG